MLESKIKIIKDCFLNILSFGKGRRLVYIIEPVDWSIKWDGKYITQNLKKLGLVKARIATASFGLKHRIVHFGSVNTFLREDGFCKLHQSNKLVLTWFHFVQEDKRNKNIFEAQKTLRFIHTSSSLTKNELVKFGVSPEKIVVIPLGVDLSLFKPTGEKEKQKLKEGLNLPQDKIIIGSFQKDGVGWGEGKEPKLIKGPDIFVKAVEKLKKNYPVFVVLIGPSRGYVKSELEKRKIPYKNIGYLKDFYKMAKYYQVLDLYLVTSRIEGGPKAILESMASGVPLITTKVGMAPDIVEDGGKVLMVEVGDIDGLVGLSQKILDNEDFRRQLIEEGIKTVKNYSWETIARRYFREIYSKILCFPANHKNMEN